MTDQEWQLEHLQQIYDQAQRSPFLKRNPLKPDPKYDKHEGPFRIAYDDIRESRYKVRIDPEYSDNAFWSENTEVVAEYRSIEAMIADGWRLD